MRVPLAKCAIHREFISLAAILASLAAAGCQRTLMPTPNLYAYGHDDAFQHVPGPFQNNIVDLLYVTDRVPTDPESRGSTYGYGRSPSLAFGSCKVQIGADPLWDALKLASESPSRSASLPLKLNRVVEMGRSPDVPFPVAVPGPRPIDDPAVVAKFEELKLQFCNELASRLDKSDCKDVYVYVHGFNNTFEDAILTTAELWHFLGRQGVPICYSWPAGRGLSGQGYNFDRESSEFTVYHLKMMLKALGGCADIHRVNIIAHSRGTDVILNAMRELNLEYKRGEETARDALKIGSVVLAAPDIDFEVFLQRAGAERVGSLPEQLTIYTSPDDWALKLADNLTLGILRLGQLRPEEISPALKAVLEKSAVTFVVARVSAGLIGHSYFIDSPAASSDIIRVLRDHAKPGEAEGRPLTKLMTNFYELTDDYLRPR